MMRKRLGTLACAFVIPGLILAAGCSMKPLSTTEPASSIDEKLRRKFTSHNMKAIERPKVNPAKAELGRLLFWDKILSGSKNISCATCHLPEAATSDALTLPVGEGGVGQMTNRFPVKEREEDFEFVRRNSPDVFNRGEFLTMFWDGRVMKRKEDGSFLAPFSRVLPDDHDIWSPANRLLPKGLDSALAAQAMFPPTSVDEMKGVSHENTLGKLEDHERKGIWTELINRVLQYKAYRQMFAKAYPDVNPDDYSFVHAANALAAFQIEAFTLTDAPFDMYLRGDDTALNEAQKRGALLFYGKANCVSCHSGHLMTDQVFHNRVVPQLGPGKGELPGGGSDGTWDGGRSGVTGWYKDAYKFRTPPLRNVEKTGPWMHDGAFATLESAVRHQLDPIASARMYDPKAHLAERYEKTFRSHQTEEIISSAKKTGEISVIKLTDSEVNDLVAFLESLTSPQLETLPYITPKRVPSGLPVED